MPTPHALAAFALASLALIIVPGPSVLFVIGRSLSYGRRGGLMSVLGNGLGGFPLVAAVAFGVGSIVAQSVLLFTIIKLLGAAYLVYLGVQAIRRRSDGSAAEAESGRRELTPMTMLRQGFVVGATNPKTIVFFVAVLPQFVSFQTGAIPLQMLLLGVVFLSIGLVCDAAWAVLAGTARSWFARSPRRLAAIRASGGAVMIGLGGGLALTGSKA
ncbi:MAG: LysE family translocator [Leucobacter sp.]